MREQEWGFRGTELVTTKSESDRFLILAKDLAHGGGDLADGRTALHSFKNRRHKIRARAGVILHTIKRGLPACSIATCAQCLQALDLFPLQGFVDALDGDGWLFVTREAVDADDRSLAGIDCALVFIRGVLNFLLEGETI